MAVAKSWIRLQETASTLMKEKQACLIQLQQKLMESRMCSSKMHYVMMNKWDHLHGPHLSWLSNLHHFTVPLPTNTFMLTILKTMASAPSSSDLLSMFVTFSKLMLYLAIIYTFYGVWGVPVKSSRMMPPRITLMAMSCFPL